MKVYADTSVFGGVFDEEFAEPSKEFFAEVKSGRFDLVVSAVVQAEIASAPEEGQRNRGQTTFNFFSWLSLACAGK